MDNCCDLFSAVHSLCGDEVEEGSLLEHGLQDEEVNENTFSLLVPLAYCLPLNSLIMGLILLPSLTLVTVRSVFSVCG